MPEVRAYTVHRTETVTVSASGPLEAAANATEAFDDPEKREKIRGRVRVSELVVKEGH